MTKPTPPAIASTRAADTSLMKSFVVLGLFFVAALALVYVMELKAGQGIPRDGSGLVVGRDFLTFWMYGKSAFSAVPSDFYNVAHYQHALAQFLGPGYPGQNFAYPPSFMLIAAPFGLIGYLPALALWSAIGIALFVMALRHYGVSRATMIAALACPAAIFGLISGQNAFVTTALLLAAFSLFDKRPWVAGILIGCLTLKPNLGILIPFLLIASSRWRIFVSASVTALVIAGVSTLLFGPESWVAFVTQGLTGAGGVLADPHHIATPFHPTIFMNLNGAGLSRQVAMDVQIVATLAAAGAVIWAFRFRRNADPLMLFALFTAATVTALPYLLIYDTLPMTVAMLLLLAGGRLDARGRVLARFVYWLPLLQIGFGVLRIPGPALVAPLFVAWVTMQLWQAGGTERQESDEAPSAVKRESELSPRPHAS